MSSCPCCCISNRFKFCIFTYYVKLYSNKSLVFLAQKLKSSGAYRGFTLKLNFPKDEALLPSHGNCASETSSVFSEPLSTIGNSSQRVLLVYSPQSSSISSERGRQRRTKARR